jgi:hypothetical protein
MNTESLYIRAFAPILAIYLKNLLAISKQQGNQSRFLFLSREGYLLKELMDAYILDSKTHISSSYLEVSRRALAGVLVSSGQLGSNYVTKEHFQGTTEMLWSARFGVPSEITSEILDLQAREKEIMIGDFSSIIRQLKIANRECPSYMTDYFENGYNYLSNSIDNTNYQYFICDVGYGGTMQSMIEQILGINLKGLYIATSSVACPQKTIATSSLQLSQRIFLNIKKFESLFESELPTVLAFRRVENLETPIYDFNSIRRSEFFRYRRRLIEEVINLLDQDLVILDSWARANYPAALEPYFTSDIGINTIHNFEDSWSGVIK